MKTAKVLYGGSGDSADILWLTGIKIHDPFYSFIVDGKVCALLNALEIGRARKNSKIEVFYDLNSISGSAGVKKNQCASEILAGILKKARVKLLEVPSDFPALEFLRLKNLGFQVEVVDGEFFPERAVKNRCEVSEIIKANTVAAAGFALVQQILESSKIEKGILFFEGKPLTSEFLRSEIEKLSSAMGACAENTIAAAGDLACDPHEVGRGKIRADSLIVVDIFPRLVSSGYFGDMTRTFLKGTPSESQVSLVETVMLAHDEAIKKVRSGITGSKVHAAVEEIFEDSGYRTYCRKGAWEGFIHSTGHGLGLDVHEFPSLSPRCNRNLEAGNVVTIEPGLYYRGVGACRIEDNVLIRKSGGAKILSEYHYEWVVD